VNILDKPDALLAAEWGVDGAIQAFGGGIAAFFGRLLGHFASLA
jgi:hypothetical protein